MSEHKTSYWFEITDREGRTRTESIPDYGKSTYSDGRLSRVRRTYEVRFHGRELQINVRESKRRRISEWAQVSYRIVENPDQETNNPVRFDMIRDALFPPEPSADSIRRIRRFKDSFGGQTVRVLALDSRIGREE